MTEQERRLIWEQLKESRSVLSMIRFFDFIQKDDKVMQLIRKDVEDIDERIYALELWVANLEITEDDKR